jgi:CRP-like cAMP-binding protein
LIAEQLKKTDLFKEVELTLLQALVERMQQEHYDSGAVLFREGDVGDAMYIIQSGSIRIFMNDEAGNEIPLTRYGQNEIFGELSPIDELPRSASAAASDDLEVLVLHRQDFLDFLNERPQIGLAMMRSLSRRLRYTTTYLEEFKPAEFETSPVKHGDELRQPAQKLVADIIDTVNRPDDAPPHQETPERPGSMGIFDRITTGDEAEKSADESAEDD